MILFILYIIILMSETFEVYVAYVVDHLADGKWSRSDWSNPVGFYSTQEAVYQDIHLEDNQQLYIQTYIFQKKYGMDIYILSPHMETGFVPLILSNNKDEMKQTYCLCVCWKQLHYNPLTDKYFIIEHVSEY